MAAHAAPGKSPGKHDQWHIEPGTQSIERDAYRSRGRGPGIELPLGTDVPDAAPEGNAQADADQDQRRCLQKNLSDRAGVLEDSQHHHVDHGARVVTIEGQKRRTAGQSQRDGRSRLSDGTQGTEQASPQGAIGLGGNR